MINSLELTNFQSHEHNRLDFSPGVNAIIGSSDSGKSAVLRALCWAIYNRPSGDSFVSWWARDKKGKQKDSCEVLVEKGDQALLRLRSGDFNGYNNNGKDIAAVRTDVPEEVQNFFNLSEVNIQRQLDGPFLLSETPGEVARFFNRTIRLDEIDKALALVDKKKRSTDSEIKTKTAEKEDQEKALEAYAWIEVVEPKLKKAQQIAEELDGLYSQADALSLSMGEHFQHTTTVKKMAVVSELETKLQRSEKLWDKILKAGDEAIEIRGTLQLYHNHSDTIQEQNRYISLEKAVENAIKAKESMVPLYADQVKMIETASQYRDFAKKIPELNTVISDIERELPDVCPLCSGTGKLK
jgi:DNA repair exonuclease SbcCD ATPase subunit